MNLHQMETKHELAEMHRATDKPEGVGTLITSQPLIWTEGSTGVGNLSLLQGIFPTQGSNSGLSHCRQILYHLRGVGVGWRLQREGIHVYLQLIPTAVQQKPVPHYKATILQSKNIFLKHK